MSNVISLGKTTEHAEKTWDTVVSEYQKGDPETKEEISKGLELLEEFGDNAVELSEPSGHQIAPTAEIHGATKIGKGAEIRPEAYVGAQVRVGDGAFVGEGAELADGAVVEDNGTVGKGAYLEGTVHGGATLPEGKRVLGGAELFPDGKILKKIS